MRISLITLAGTLLASPMSAQAADVPIEYKCDAPAGSYDDKIIALNSDEISVTGTLALNATKLDVSWNPKAVIYYMSDQRPLLGMIAELADGLTWKISVFTGRGIRTLGAVSKGATLPFRLEVTPGRKGVLIAGKSRAEVKLPNVNKPNVLLGCSTTSAEFKELNWGVAQNGNQQTVPITK